jgi:hypothetical protein
MRLLKQFRWFRIVGIASGRGILSAGRTSVALRAFFHRKDG